jgi:hypothetical protein
LFGLDWLYETWKYIQEDKVEQYKILMAVAPMARTPMDKKGAGALRKYIDKLNANLRNALPWLKKEPVSGRLAYLREKVKPGEVVVILDDGESKNDPLFEGAKIIRE